MTRIASFLNHVGISLVLGCGAGEVRHAAPIRSAEERALREAYVASRPDLHPVLRQELLAFDITVDDAFRRQSYLDSHPELSRNRALKIVRGVLEPLMASDEVEAAWGPPDGVEDASDDEREREIWTYARAPGAYGTQPVAARLTFEDRRLVDIRQASD